MPTLTASLNDSDAALYPVLAARWKVDITNLKPGETVQALAAQMLDAAAAERVYETLDDDQRGALQTLLGSGGKMPMPMFARLYGEVRLTSKALISREKPQDNPQGTAEALFRNPRHEYTRELMRAAFGETPGTAA